MERLHGIASAALAGRLDRARSRPVPVDEALAELRGLRGVGPFIAEGILLRGAGVVDAVPSDELTLQAMQRAYELANLPSKAEALKIAEAVATLSHVERGAAAPVAAERCSGLIPAGWRS